MNTAKILKICHQISTPLALAVCQNTFSPPKIFPLTASMGKITVMESATLQYWIESTPYAFVFTLIPHASIHLSDWVPKAGTFQKM